jgi:hypothetical protein
LLVAGGGAAMTGGGEVTRTDLVEREEAGPGAVGWGGAVHVVALICGSERWGTHRSCSSGGRAKRLVGCVERGGAGHPWSFFLLSQVSFVGLLKSRQKLWFSVVLSKINGS